MPPYTTNLEYLRDEFHRLDLLLQTAILQFKGVVFLASRVSWQPRYCQHYQFIQMELPLPDEPSRLLLWQTYLNHHISPEVNLNYLASVLKFSGGQIQQAIA